MKATTKFSSNPRERQKHLNHFSKGNKLNRFALSVNRQQLQPKMNSVYEGHSPMFRKIHIVVSNKSSLFRNVIRQRGGSIVTNSGAVALSILEKLHSGTSTKRMAH
jgi:hypothetical protein